MAIYKYITDEDLNAVVHDVLIKEALENDLKLIKRAESIAIQTIKDKIKFRFDISSIFTLIPEWKPTIAFNSGDPCYYQGEFYVALQGSTDKAPNQNTDHWKNEDPREMVIVAKCTDITVYHIFKRVNPRKIPSNIKEAYVEAKEWLKDIQNQMEHPDLPIIIDEIDEVPFFGKEPLDHFY